MLLCLESFQLVSLHQISGRTHEIVHERHHGCKHHRRKSRPYHATRPFVAVNLCQDVAKKIADREEQDAGTVDVSQWARAPEPLSGRTPKLEKESAPQADLSPQRLVLHDAGSDASETM